jgi:hypothetical protein
VQAGVRYAISARIDTGVRIEIQRLVHQERRRLPRDRPTERHALLLAPELRGLRSRSASSKHGGDLAGPLPSASCRLRSA